MKTLAVEAERDASVSSRQELLIKTERLPRPDINAFRKVPPPPSSELEAYRIVEENSVREQLLASGLGGVVQRPGSGNWSKSAPPPYIFKIYPNFDAPAATVKAPRVPRLSSAMREGGALSGAVLHVLMATS